MRTLLLIRNSFRCEVKDVQLDMQEEFIELINSSSDKLDIHETQDLVIFWLAMPNNYPQLAYTALQVLLSFSSTYLCESAFSTPCQQIETNSLMLKLIYDAH